MLSAHSCPMGRLGAKDTGGMSVYILELARELGKRGHLVDIYTRLHDPSDGQIIEVGENVRLIHLRAGEDGEVHKLAVYPHLPGFACHLEDFREDSGIRYDLIHSHYWLSAWAGRFLQVWWDVPHLTMFHTVGAIKNAIGIGESEPELRIKTERCIIENSQRIIVATEREKGDLVRHCGASPDGISVIPCGVNMELFQPVDREVARHELGFAGDEKHVLFVGRIEPLKGVDRLVKAMARLNDPKVRLWIIGGDERSRQEVERLQKFTHELNIQGSVNFLGLVRQSELPQFYSAADVCVIPSHYESFGLVVLESLACGTPVVAADVGGARSIIRQGKTGYVVSGNAPYLLAPKIERILSRPQPNAESINSMRASIARYSWSNIATAVVAEYRAVIEAYSAQRAGVVSSRT
jgi:D-inositol-3-phosphate glycosyltransferase